MSKLVLGTAQFGFNYGVANQNNGRPPFEEVKNILKVAHHGGIQILDTAVAYGNSEQILGQIGIANWKVITKLPPVPTEISNVAFWVEETIQASLKRLKCKQIDILLLHRSSELLKPYGEIIKKTIMELNKISSNQADELLKLAEKKGRRIKSNC